ncbi:Metacaspase-1 [Quillaja saponaria]|uniref:Metacaspase-1 n=1 Tax=Quillaja saponaria TaxID=32244 RepID=A0AAD7PU09_QUISA|nr:Metacaspase-1 [Quillaja saponaria]
MARRQRCSWCGMQLLVPPEAPTIQCAVCHGITQVPRPVDPFGVSGRYRGFTNNYGTTATNNSPGFRGYGSYPQPPRPQPPLMAPSAYGRKRALLCGIRYHGQSHGLKGSVNDVMCMREFLIDNLGFPSDCILMLTDSKNERNPLKFPTKHNMIMALRWLVQGCQSGDSLVFHFSGHGSRVQDVNMDEIDGYDEALCPVDYESQGKIVDDEINDIIVRPLPRGAKLHAIFDTCYSGTVLDVPYICRMNREGLYLWQDQRRYAAIYKGTSGGLAVSISACDDNQTGAADTPILSGNTMGTLTYSFIQAVQKEPGLTYGRLLNAMRRTIREAKVGIAGLRTEISQEPQLASSEKFEIYSTKIVL